MGTVPIWKQWLIIAACILVSPAIVFALVCGFGWLVFRRLWPRNPRVARQSAHLSDHPKRNYFTAAVVVVMSASIAKVSIWAAAGLPDRRRE